jgi:hypothetical protein
LSAPRRPRPSLPHALRAQRRTLCPPRPAPFPITPANDVLTAELLSSIEDFSTAASVNQFLGTLTKQLVRKRIQRRDAIALAYLSQLLLNSLSAMSREEAQTQREEAQQPLEIIWDNFPQRRVENRLESRVLGDTTTLADPAVAARPENAI